MAWLSPSFPVGAFSYSSGIEWAVEAGDIKDAETLKAWLGVMLSRGRRLLRRRAVRACASRGHERRRQGAARGRRTRRRLRAVEGAPSRNHRAGQCLRRSGARGLGLRRDRKAEDDLGRPGGLSGRGGGGSSPATASRSSRRSRPTCRRSPPTGCRPACGSFRSARADGQRVLAALEPAVTATAQRALTAKLDDLGSSAFRADLASARHETQYTRLFRS